ncbi:MAG: zinc ribbon domain-containing protein [Clostridia bacterium]|nr:zinc ribbon domain-containing protein [Clostridia bacterium]
MFKNVGGKLRGIAIVFFVFNCIISAFILITGVLTGVFSRELSTMIAGILIGILGATAYFGLSLIPIYMFFGYGTLIKSCEENARTSEAILAFLRNSKANECKPVQPVVEAPVVEAPVVEAPVVEAPVVEAPVVEEPVVEAPVVEAPVVEAPVVEEPVAETPVEEAAAPMADDADFVSDDGEEKTVVLPKEGEPLVKRCPSCGNVVRPQANFCNQCGYKMK